MQEAPPIDNELLENLVENSESLWRIFLASL